MIKKADIILAFLLILCGISASFGLAGSGDSGVYAEISVSGEYYGTYDLHENREITIQHDHHINVLQIKDGAIAMVDSDCYNKQCIHQGPIRKSPQIIVCLPNRVFVNIIGGDKEFDAVTY